MRHVRFTYQNWRGEVSERHVLPSRIAFTASEWHPDEQWVLIGYDVDKQHERYFPLQHIVNLRPAESPG